MERSKGHFAFPKHVLSWLWSLCSVGQSLHSISHSFSSTSPLTTYICEVRTLLASHGSPAWGRGDSGSHFPREMRQFSESGPNERTLVCVADRFSESRGGICHRCGVGSRSVVAGPQVAALPEHCPGSRRSLPRNGSTRLGLPFKHARRGARVGEERGARRRIVRASRRSPP